MYTHLLNGTYLKPNLNTNFTDIYFFSSLVRKFSVKLKANASHSFLTKTSLILALKKILSESGKFVIK
jgi:hypothetical protein